MSSEIPFSERVLRRSAEFQMVLRAGSRVFFEKKIVFYVAPAKASHFRFGLTVPKARIRRAVERNQIKRWCRESFRKLWNTSPNVSTDIVVVIQGKLNYVEIQNAFEQLHQVLQRPVHS